ncbi:CobD/CbiB family protein [Ideonella livida]|uniref:Cobalamin biosynthesis protein CobD n=1 Tax=Ideonella livida TaxID=2707176 RepID=A0A7C9TLJ2_9BURK|nr:CobD/CbiB family protein [Ideonella livida]NDY92323.1 CobD/CbiB family protein [Ideonella livida]
MSFFAVLLALALEQFKPLPRDNWVFEGMGAWLGWCGRNFDAGQPRHARVVWAMAVLLPALLVAVLHALLYYGLSFFLALAFDVGMLYLCLGFRQFSHYHTDIREALERGDEDTARRLLAEWRHLDVSEVPRNELLRHLIEHALLAAHRHVFGVFFCYVVFNALGLGPAGAVLYRMAEFASRYWAHESRRADAASGHEEVADLSARWYGLVDHVPARLTAAGFAVVGNFEEAVAGWRRDAGLWLRPNEGIILAAAAGAVGVQLGGAQALRPHHPGRQVDLGAAQSTGSTPGLPPQTGHLSSVVGLVWRSVVLWMLLLALLKLANLLG